MLPILFPPNSKEYNSNGIGVLVDAISCVVTEERNGAFELEMKYPVTGSKYKDIAVDCQILAKPNETGQNQAFRIYCVSKPINGIVTVFAEHISYQLSSILVSPFTAGTVGLALSAIKSNSINENPFDFWTDKTTMATMSMDIPHSARSLLGGVAGSVLDTYTGEYEFDNYLVKLYQNRGRDNGVVIAYAKNLTGVKCDEHLDGVATGCIGYWQQEGEDGNVTTVIGDLQSVETNLSYSRNVILDCSTDFEQTPTKEAINNRALNYLKNKKNAPYVSVSVEFINLGDTEEYKQYKGLERVSLCDIVTVKHPSYGISVKAKVVKTIYNCLSEKYDRIEIGEARANISQTISAQQNEINQSVTSSDLEVAINNATNLITGNKGGYVVLHPAKSPQEILVMDSPDINSALNVWRFNKSGLGHSSTGYNGTYGLAMTMDGAIVADRITAGTLNGALIKAGTVTANSISVEYKKQVTDEINNSATTLEQKFIVADGELRSEITETLKSYSTTTQTSSMIAQTSDTIMLEVNKKVNDSEFGTKIIQNYDSVQISWNTISKYIQFEDASLNIYNGEELLMSLNSNGMRYWYEGTYIGHVGTGGWNEDPDFRGVVFMLNTLGDYMTWAHKENEDDEFFTVQMVYYANDKKYKKGLHFSSVAYADDDLYISEDVRTRRVSTSGQSDGSGGLYSLNSDIYFWSNVSNGGTLFSIGQTVWIGNNLNQLVDCRNNIDMNSYSILNQSDARFKENIRDSEVNAIEVLSKIDLKEFDWIESGEHVDVGMIAQQVKEVIPDLVNENPITGKLSIKTDKFIPYLVAAVQELSGNNKKTRKTKWTDTYDQEEKEVFIKKNKFSQPKETEKPEPLRIPIRRSKNVKRNTSEHNS